MNAQVESLQIASPQTDRIHLKRVPITPIQANKIIETLPAIEPMLRRVVKPDTGLTMESVISDLLSGATQLWVIGDFNALSITRIQDRYTERVLWNEWVVGENMDEWAESWMEVQEAYAKATNCHAIEFSGRIGYRRYEKKFKDFKPIRMLYRRELKAE